MKIEKVRVSYLGLGSNLGDKEHNIKNALAALDAHSNIKIIQASSIIQTPPLASMQQPDYLNCVCKIETSLTPQQLLEAIKKIEANSGRKKTDRIWASRCIDIDILLYEQETVKTAELTIPHKDMHLRSFVLAGLNELCHEYVHPLIGEKISVLYKRLGGRNFYLDSRRPQLIGIAGTIGAGKSTLAGGLKKQCGYRLIKESYDTNPFLKEVYSGKAEFALDSQLYFFISRLEQLSPENFTDGRIAVSDYIMAQETIYADIWLSSEQLKLYKKINSHMSRAAVLPTVVVYLQASPKECLKRIRIRNRPYEQNIDIKFLEHLCGEYEKLFENFSDCPVLTVDADSCDYRLPESIQKLACRLTYYLPDKT